MTVCKLARCSTFICFGYIQNGKKADELNGKTLSRTRVQSIISETLQNSVSAINQHKKEGGSGHGIPLSPLKIWREEFLVHTSSVLRKSLVLYSTISPDGFSLESSSTASDARLSILPMSCMGVHVKEAGSGRKKKGRKEGRRGGGWRRKHGKWWIKDKQESGDQSRKLEVVASEP